MNLNREHLSSGLLGLLIGAAYIGLTIYIADRGSSTDRIERRMHEIRPADVYEVVTTELLIKVVDLQTQISDLHRKVDELSRLSAEGS